MISIIPITVNAKHIHHHYRSHSVYIIGSHRHPVYVFNWHNISNFRNYRGTFEAKDDPAPSSVKIIGRAKVGQNIFYKIRNKSNRNFNGWIYSGNLSHNPRRGRYYNFGKLITYILRSETDSHASLFLKQMKYRTMTNLNRDRSKYHIAKLTENHQLDSLAQLRAKQLIGNFNHYNQNGTPYTTVDAPKVQLPADFQASENIASAGLGKNTLQGDKKHYQNRNGYNMADTDNDGMMYHDRLEQNGHRRNILDSRSTMVGIGTAYDPRQQIFYLAEDFGNHNANSSEDITS